MRALVCCRRCGRPCRPLPLSPLAPRRALPALSRRINYHIIPDDKLTKKTLSALQTWGTNLDGKDIAVRCAAARCCTAPGPRLSHQCHVPLACT
jgi:hypothetical protein